MTNNRAWLLVVAMMLAGARGAYGQPACTYPSGAKCAVYFADVEMYFSDGVAVTGSGTFTLIPGGAGPWIGMVTDRFPCAPEYNSHYTQGQWSVLSITGEGYQLSLGGHDAWGILSRFVTDRTFTGEGTYQLHTDPLSGSYVNRPCPGPYTPSAGKIVITKICSFPSIVTQPADTGIDPGDTATLTVSATGNGLTYQWYEGPAHDRSHPIAGATGASLEVSSPSATKKYWVEVSGMCGDPAISATAEVYIRHWVALGDSYSSGEGAWNYLAETNQTNNKCHRSELAYSQVTLDVEDSADVFLACSGATTVNVLPVPYGGKGQYAAPDDIPQLERLELATADFVTITIGGNDIGFGPILKICWQEADCRNYKPFSWSSNPQFAATSLGAYLDDVIEYQKTQVLTTLQAIREAAPRADIRILGYPSPFPAEANRQTCFDFQLCFKDWSPQEQNFFNEYVPKLNNALRFAAQQSHVRFIDVQSYFDDHEICGKDGSWFVAPGNCLSAILGSVVEYFHPTPEGHLDGYRRALEDDLALVPRGTRQEGAADVALLTSALRPTLDALRVVVVAPACAGLATPGKELAVSGTGYQPGSEVKIVLIAPAEQQVAVVNADAAGGFSNTITLPSSVAPTPFARIEARGIGANLLPRLLLAHFPIGASLDGDGDGDGVPDPCDNCRDAANATQTDTDGDVLGDVCDLCPADAFNRCAAARFGPPNAFVATATSLTQVSLTWEAVADASGYEIQRRDPNGAFASIATTAGLSHTDTALAPGKAYLYRVRTLGPQGPSAYGASDLATTAAFTESVAAGMRVKALHIAELLAAVNAVRAAAGLPALTFSSAITSGTVVKASHLTALRSALDEARAVLSTYGLSYKDATVIPQVTTIKAAHWSEIRAGIR